MGVVLGCHGCGYSASFRQGKGMKGWGGYENLSKFLTKKDFKKVQELVGDLTVASCDINMATYLCHHCGTLNERLDYQIGFQPAGEYRPNHRCSNCRKTLLRRIDLTQIKDGFVEGDKNSQLICPKCRITIHEVSLIDWD